MSKITIVSKFPKVMKAASQVRVQLQAMTCTLERASSVCQGDTTCETVVADVFFIFFFCGCRFHVTSTYSVDYQKDINDITSELNVLIMKILLIFRRYQNPLFLTASA